MKKGLYRPGGLPLSHSLRAVFHSQVDPLPEATQTLLVIAAAEEGLDEVLATAERFGKGVDDLLPAEKAGLITLDGQRIAFRHPLIREAVYQRAPMSLRLAVHAALAETLTGDHRADRRAWHLAAAATGPDEHVAAELERTGARAARRRGHAVAAGAYERAAALTEAGPGTRARRLTLGAEAATEAGDLDWAAKLAAEAESQAVSQTAGQAGADPLLRSRIAHVQATALLWRGEYGQAHRLMLRAADLDPALLVRACQTAWYVGEPELAEIAERLVAAPPDGPMAALARLEAVALAQLTGVGRAGHPVPLAQALAQPFEETLDGTLEQALGQAIARAEENLAGQPPGLAAMTCGAPLIVGADDAALRLARGLVTRCHAEGSLGVLPMVLFFLAQAELFRNGHPDDVADTASTALRVAQDTGQHQWAVAHKGLLAYLAAMAGDEERCRTLTAETLAGPAVPMPGAHWADWARALFDLGHGRIEAALTRLEALTNGPGWYHVSAMRCVPDLVEAAVRRGEPGRAEHAVARYSRLGQRHLTERCRALLAEDAAAERHYLAALAVQAPPFERARTSLLYGEWLRRARRRSAAIPQLRDARDTFERLGARPWADRAGNELRAAGARSADTPSTDVTGPSGQAGLTSQERQIVRLAARGLSNKDIAAQLFLSPRTVGYHLYKAYPKLGVASRAELVALD